MALRALFSAAADRRLTAPVTVIFTSLPFGILVAGTLQLFGDWSGIPLNSGIFHSLLKINLLLHLYAVMLVSMARLLYGFEFLPKERILRRSGIAILVFFPVSMILALIPAFMNS